MEPTDHAPSRLSWLWGSRNSITGTGARDLEDVVSTVLSWSDAMWDAIESYLQIEESRLAFRGAWILLQLHAEGRCVATSEKTSDSAKFYLTSSDGDSSWLCTLRAIDLALAAASQSRFTPALRACHTEVRRSSRHDAAESASRLPLGRVGCGCPLVVNGKNWGQSSNEDTIPLLQALLMHYRGSVLSHSSARALGGSAIYTLTAGMVVTTALKTYLNSLDTESTKPLIPTSSTSSGTSENVRCAKSGTMGGMGKTNRRFGVAWIREVRDLSYICIQPTISTLDDAACGLWVFLRLVQSQRRLGRRACVPHPCRLREALQKLYKEWTAECGYSFTPMRRLIGGSARGLNSVRLLLYSKPRHRYDNGASSRVFDWNFVVALAATCNGVGVADSFEMARAACEEFRQGNVAL